MWCLSLVAGSGALGWWLGVGDALVVTYVICDWFLPICCVQTAD